MQRRVEDLGVVAVFSWGRSGSALLHSLFDSHPEVLAIPGRSLNGYHAWQWATIARERGTAAMARRFIECNPAAFDGARDPWLEGLGTLGPEPGTPLRVDAAAFTERVASLLSGSEPTRREFFLAAHVAYALARGQDISERTTIIYRLGSPEAYPAIAAAIEDFPGLRGVGSVREPIRSTLADLLDATLLARAWNHADRSEHAQLAPSGAQNRVYRQHLNGWRELAVREPLPFYSVRVEDLERDIEGQMRKLAAWLNLRWEPCLAQSTCNGLRYDPTGPGAPCAEAPDAALDALDRYVLRGLCWRLLRDFDYGRASKLQRLLTPLLVLAPTRLERLALRARAASLLSPGAPPAEGTSARATLLHMLARQALSYRHLVCEALPELRSRLPAPRPLEAELGPPEAAAPPRFVNGAAPELSRA